MKEIIITNEIREQAMERARQMGELKNSIRQGEGNLVGFIGEIVVNNYIKGSLANTYDYDILKEGIKYDVKSKETTVKPKPYYECSIADYNPNQDCDFYIFTRVLNDHSKCWILGLKSKEDYFKESRFLKKGQIDGTNQFVVKADCHNLEISRLQPIDNFFVTIEG